MGYYPFPGVRNLDGNLSNVADRVLMRGSVPPVPAYRSTQYALSANDGAVFVSGDVLHIYSGRTGGMSLRCVAD